MSGLKRRGGVQKADILKWANDQQQLDMRSKAILKELASFAGEDCCAWSQVATLAWAANCVDRTVQLCLGKLKAEGLIEDTGRSHRLEGSTRSVPIYRLAPDVEGLGRSRAMGEEISPIGGAWVKSGEGMGETCVHPHRVHGVQGSSDELPPGGRARDALISDIEAAMDRRTVSVSDRAAYLDAVAELASEGVEVAELPGCIRRWAADPLFASRKVPVPLERWLRSGQWRAYLPQPELVLDAQAATACAIQAPPGETAIWVRVMADMQAMMGEALFGSWLGPASLGQIGEDLFVVARTGTAERWLREHRWPELASAWARHDAAGRSLTLIAKSEFEARVRHGGE